MLQIENDVTNQVRILVADDDQMIRETLRFVFEDANYSVLEAGDGLVALARLRASREPLVVVLDLMMPRLDGVGVLQAVANDPALCERHTFVLITANMVSFPPEFSQLLASLSVSVVRKPFDIDVVLDTVEGSMHKLRQRRRLRSSGSAQQSDRRSYMN